MLQTEFCGWGVEAAEPITKGEFIVEYIGEGRFIFSMILVAFYFDSLF